MKRSRTASAITAPFFIPTDAPVPFMRAGRRSPLAIVKELESVLPPSLTSGHGLEQWRGKWRGLVKSLRALVKSGKTALAMQELWNIAAHWADSAQHPARLRNQNDVSGKYMNQGYDEGFKHGNQGRVKGGKTGGLAHKKCTFTNNQVAEMVASEITNRPSEPMKIIYTIVSKIPGVNVSADWVKRIYNRQTKSAGE